MALVTLSQDLSVYWLALDPSLELRVVLEARSSAVDLIHVPHRHLAPLFDNPKLDKELRAMLREKFPEFCSSPSPPVEVKIEEPVSMEMDNHMSDKDESCYDNAEAAFSDDEEDLNSKGEVGSRGRAGL